MLTDIQIQQLVTIESLSLSCRKGTTTLTGETGAGKSILIDAILLALGDRLNGEVVRTGADKADICLSFDVTHLKEAREWLKSYELDNESNECHIRRTITKDGRSRCFINGMPSTLQPLRELSELLIQIHGQHEHQSLLNTEKQRDILDHYADHPELTEAVATYAKSWQTTHRQLKELETQSLERTQRCDYLSFQLNELNELKLVPNEFQSLDLEHKQLAHADELLKNLNQALHYLAEDEENNTFHQFKKILQCFESVAQVDPKISIWIESVKSIQIQLSDLENELRHYLDATDLDPERLQWIENRLSTLFNIARKHKVEPQELVTLQDAIEKEYHSLTTSDEQIKKLRAELIDLEKHYLTSAKKLSESRQKAALRLEKEITRMIKELSLPHGEFHIQFEPETTSFALHGLDKITFQIKTNQGLSMQPLAKIASGGELSRISLAIHMATADHHTVPTLIFDEVDVGIGGGTAEMVGKLLRKLGDKHQVLCITHLPQVAAQGHHHLRVSKRTEKQSTYTQLEYLSEEERIHELARMLGGVKMTQTTLAHAKEMIEKV